MELPAAYITHRTAERIRVRIPSRKGEATYFSEVTEVLQRNVSMVGVQVNPATGSVLLTGPQMDIPTIASIGEQSFLFALDMSTPERDPLSKRIAAPFHDLSRSIDRVSGGELDLPGMAFLALIGVGVYQIVRGNIGAPPWYSAFWYALGLFTKHIMDKA